jgi:hypothetical protein
MKNPRTAYCCGPKDCEIVDKSEVVYKKGDWYVRGVMVFKESVFLSPIPDANYHACFADPPAMSIPRCLFVPGFM